MITATVTVTITKKVQLDPEAYGTDSPEDMLEMEKQYAENLTREWMSDGDLEVYVEGLT